MPHGHAPVALLDRILVRHFSGDVFAGCGDLGEGCVTIAIAAQGLGLDLAAIGEGDGKFLAASLFELGRIEGIDHVGGRQNQSVFGDDNTAADAAEVAYGLAGVLHHAHDFFLALLDGFHDRIGVHG